MVRVICQDYTETFVNIHALREASAVLSGKLDIPRPNISQIELNVDGPCFHILAIWISDGEINWEAVLDQLYEDEADDRDGVDLLCSAYTMGKSLALSAAFFDEVMDCLVKLVTKPTVRTGLEMLGFVAELRTNFSAGMKGRDFPRGLAHQGRYALRPAG
jgi:hypothetical protein